MTRHVRIYPNAAELARAGAVEFIHRARMAITDLGRFAVALSGGTTPRLLFRDLAAENPASGLAWDRIHFFWGDERAVPPEHPDSNFRTAQEELFSRVTVPPGNIHRMRGEDGVSGALAYEEELKSFFGVRHRQVPRFDLVLLGMGADGHTASLFPGYDALSAPAHLVAAPWVETLGARRLTLTTRVLNNAAAVIFLVAGQEKAAMLKHVLEGPRRPLALPSQAVQPRNGEILWFVDSLAAQLLSQRYVSRQRAITSSGNA